MTMNLQTIWKFLAGAVITAVVLFLLWYFSSIVVYILVSAVLAVMGRPLVCRLMQIRIRKWQMPRALAALVTLVVIWAIAATIGMLFLPLVFDKIYEFSNLDFATVIGNIEQPIAQAQRYLSDLFAMPVGSFSLQEALISQLKSWIDLESINQLFSSIVGLLLSSAVALFSISFITFFFLKEDGLFYAMVTAVFPERYSENITRALDEVTYLLSRYFRGLLTESLVLMIAVTITMTAFGMKLPDAAFIGLVMGVMNVVPYAGPLLGGVLSLFVGVVSPIEGQTIGYTMIIIVCSLLALKSLDDFILQPTLYSERVKAHPLEVFLVILVAGSAAGILGMLLAIPGYTVLRVFAKEFFSQFSLVRKLTEKI
ncbi:MAG: AI-2E family transporter [Alistipes sp.]|nr:AI-2E family transporter [Alistipes sp.]